MKALLYTEPGKGSITDIPMPVCGSDQVVMKVESCGICFHAEMGHNTTGTNLAKYPVVPGHEFAGVISEVGKEVTGLKVGDRITADNTVLCGHCYYCKNGQPNRCETYGSLGHNINGGFAEYLMVGADKVFKIQDKTTFDEACLTETVACCVHCIDRCNIQYGDHVAVFGAGPNGTILAQLAKHSNAGKVVTIAGSQAKLDTLAMLGIDTIRLDRNDYAKHEAALKEMFPEGLDLIIDATASPQVIASTFKLLKKGGRFMQYSWMMPGEEACFPIDAGLMMTQELSYLSSCCQTHTFGRALQAIETGVIDTKSLITHHFPLDSYFEALELNGADKNAVKVIIHPDMT